MSSPYRIFGAEMSPYSVKMRSYARYKGLAHAWVNRGGDNAAEYAKYARVPIIPLVVTPEGEGLQDSTPIIERLEALHPEPAIHPADPALAFLSALLEEVGDEWGNKWMFHYRWRREVDQMASAGRIALSMNPSMNETAQTALAEQIRARMVGRVWFVGSSDTTAQFIEDSFHDALALPKRWAPQACGFPLAQLPGARQPGRRRQERLRAARPAPLRDGRCVLHSECATHLLPFFPTLNILDRLTE